MHLKYGSQINWFENIVGIKDATSITVHNFKQKISKMIKGTQHSQCIEKISSFFPKSCKNIIQWNTFIGVIRNTNMSSRNKYYSSRPRTAVTINSYGGFSVQSRYNRQQSNQRKLKNYESFNLQTSLNSKKINLLKPQSKRYLSIKLPKREIKFLQRKFRLNYHLQTNKQK